MGEIHVNIYSTLDGVIQAPGGPDEDPTAGFRFGGWQAPLMDEETGAVMSENLAGIDALLLGRRTYDIFASFWPTATVDTGFAEVLNRIPKYVVTRNRDLTLDWHGARLADEDLVTQVRQLRERHDQTHTFGSADLFQTLLAEDLVDRLNLWLYPIVLGTGKKIFPDGAAPSRFRLTSPARSFPGGGVFVQYALEPGEPQTGDMSDPDR